MQAWNDKRSWVVFNYLLFENNVDLCFLCYLEFHIFVIVMFLIGYYHLIFLPLT
jgi:hypothetical protein